MLSKTDLKRRLTKMKNPAFAGQGLAEICYLPDDGGA